MYLRFILSCFLWLAIGGGLMAQTNRNQPMHEMDFEGLITELDAEFSESNRLKKARKALDNHYFSAAQARQIIEQFTMKDHQEVLAKQAYAHLVDPSNYYQIYSALTFADSRVKLGNWVKEQPRPSNNSHFQPEPLQEAVFKQRYAVIEEEPFDADRMRIIEQLVDHHYLNTDQVHQLVGLFDFKSSQEALVRYAYPKTYDQQNYLQVLEACTFSSSKRSLRNWLKGQSVLDRNNPNRPVTGVWQVSDDSDDVSIHYPTVGTGTNYDNPPPTSSNLHLPLSDADFNNLQNQLRNISNDQDRLVRIQQVSGQARWKAAQVQVLMDLLVFEKTRLDLALHAYNHTIDVENYYLVYNALNSAVSQQQLVDYAQQVDRGSNRSAHLYDYHRHKLSQASSRGPIQQAQPVSAAAWADALQKLRSHSSDNDRLQAAKRFVDTHSLTTTQVLDVLNLLIFDDVKLDCAKYMYSHVVDPQNYSVVVNGLSRAQDQVLLQNYMDKKGQ